MEEPVTMGTTWYERQNNKPKSCKQQPHNPIYTYSAVPNKGTCGLKKIFFVRIIKEEIT